MKKNKVYMFGSSLWPGCAPAKKFLEENGIKFAYFDITESLGSLKRFLVYRDTAPEYEEIRGKEKVGIPVLVINNGEKIVFDIEGLSKEELELLK